MRTTSRRLFFILVVFVAGPTSAQNISDFLSCLANYESKALGVEVDQAKVDEEVESQKKLPLVSTAVVGQRDFANNPNQTKNTNWTVDVSQNIYSHSISRSIQARGANVKAEQEDSRAQLLKRSLEKLDELISFVTLQEQLRVAKGQVERLGRVAKLFEALNKTKISDGAPMLMALSDKAQTEARISEIETSMKNLESRLRVYTFFPEQAFQSFQSKQNFFSFPEDLRPLDIEKRAVVKMLDLQGTAAQLQLKSNESQWWPRLDAGIGYTQALSNPESLTVTNEVLGTLTLTVPLDELYTDKALRSYSRAQFSRLTVQRERAIKDLKIEAENDEKKIRDAKSAIGILEGAKKLLSTARTVMMKKLELNRVSYFEISSLDDKIDQAELDLAQKYITIWQIYSKWALQRITESSQSKFEYSKCQ